MNNKQKIILGSLISMGVILIPSTILLTSTSNNNSFEENIEFDKDKIIKVPDYILGNDNHDSIEKNKVMKRIKLIVDSYNLDGWVKWYSENNNYKTRIWEPKWSGYDFNNNKVTNNAYNEQDEQYKYFEDFIFTINPLQLSKEKKAPENIKDSFLFRRYQILSMKRADDYNKMELFVNDLTWNAAYVAANPPPIPPSPSPPPPNLEPLHKIQEHIVDFFKNYFYKPYLAAGDLYMRVENKDYDKYGNKESLEWAKKIWDYEFNLKSKILTKIKNVTPPILTFASSAILAIEALLNAPMLNSADIKENDFLGIKKWKELTNV